MKTQTRIALGLGVAGLLAGAGVAWAQSATQDVSLTASVSPFCKFVNANIPSGTRVNISVDSVSTAASAVHITNPINTVTGQLSAATFQLRLGSVCNTQSGVVLTSLNGGMTPTTPRAIDPGSTSSFATRIDYSVSGAWPTGGSVNLTTTGVAGESDTGATVSGPRDQALFLTFTIDANPTTIIAAGTYSDTLTVRLEPR